MARQYSKSSSIRDSMLPFGGETRTVAGTISLIALTDYNLGDLERRTMTTSTQNNSKFRAWIQATRPRVFTASFVPMGLAAVIAIQDGTFVWWKFILALLGVMLLQT